MVEILGLRFELFKVGEILGNDDNDMHVGLKRKQPSLLISGIFQGMLFKNFKYMMNASHLFLKLN